MREGLEVIWSLEFVCFIHKDHRVFKVPVATTGQDLAELIVSNNEAASLHLP